MSVDLPLPDGPMIAVNLLRSNETLTLSRAVTRVSPAPYTLLTFSVWAAVAVSAGEGVVVVVTVERLGPERSKGTGGGLSPLTFLMQFVRAFGSAVWLRGNAEVGLELLESLGETLSCLFIGKGRNNDDVVAIGPVCWGRHLVAVSELQRIDNAK